MIRISLTAALLLCALATGARGQPVEPVSVSATLDQIVVHLPATGHKYSLHGLACFTPGISADSERWRGVANGQSITLARLGPDGRDRLFDRYVLADEAGGPAGHGRYASDFTELPAPSHAMDWPESIKGVQSPLVWDDLPALGVRHITVNISICTLIRGPATPADTDPGLHYAVDGVTYAFNEAAVARLDREVRWMTERGINCVGIILCYVPRHDPTNPLVHPAADVSLIPNNLTAVNLTTAEGERRYRAVMGLLGRRYMREDMRFGRIGGFVIGNELQSHWHWHNMGEQEPAEVIRQYADQLRLSYYALREHHVAPRVFASFDHFWSMQHGKNPKRALPGRVFLDSFAAVMRSRGDLPWHVAWHPYPENLFDPAFWDDRTAWFAFDTPRITYRNPEVLIDYLSKDELLYNGERRRVIFSEQGFHAGDSEESERVQAAAYAAAHVRISAIEGIDAHILHRHTDHPREGGLNLGLRRCDARGRPLGKRLIFDVFAAAETDRQDEVFRFALPIIGIDSWEQMLPMPGPFPEARPE